MIPKILEKIIIEFCTNYAVNGSAYRVCGVFFVGESQAAQSVLCEFLSRKCVLLLQKK